MWFPPSPTPALPSLLSLLSWAKLQPQMREAAGSLLPCQGAARILRQCWVPWRVHPVHFPAACTPFCNCAAPLLNCLKVLISPQIVIWTWGWSARVSAGYLLLSVRAACPNSNSPWRFVPRAVLCVGCFLVVAKPSEANHRWQLQVNLPERVDQSSLPYAHYITKNPKVKKLYSLQTHTYSLVVGSFKYPASVAQGCLS